MSVLTTITDWALWRVFAACRLRRRSCRKKGKSRLQGIFCPQRLSGGARHFCAFRSNASLSFTSLGKSGIEIFARTDTLEPVIQFAAADRSQPLSDFGLRCRIVAGKLLIIRVVKFPL